MNCPSDPIHAGVGDTSQSREPCKGAAPVWNLSSAGRLLLRGEYGACLAYARDAIEPGRSYTITRDEPLVGPGAGVWSLKDGARYVTHGDFARVLARALAEPGRAWRMRRCGTFAEPALEGGGE